MVVGMVKVYGNLNRIFNTKCKLYYDKIYVSALTVDVKRNVYFMRTLSHKLLMAQKKRSSTKPKRLKPRDTVSFRLLPETKKMLDRAAAQTDTTLGRYIEKALIAQFRKDGIKEEADDRQ